MGIFRASAILGMEVHTLNECAATIHSQSFSRCRCEGIATNKMEASSMRTSLSLLVLRSWQRLQMSLREIFLQPKSAFLLLVLLGGSAHAASYTVTVYLPTAQMQSDFIAATTTQYIATFKDGLFGKNVTITDKNGSYIPPVVSSPIATNTAFQECMTHGFAWGMETERTEDLRTIKSFRDELIATGNCGGMVSASTIPVVAYRDGCHVAYNIITSTITQKTAPPNPLTLFGK